MSTTDTLAGTARAGADSVYRYVERTAAVARRLLAAEPGPVTDFLGGAAGEGIFLTRFWQTTGDARHLQDAMRRAEWLAERAVRGAAGCRPAHVCATFSAAVELIQRTYPVDV